MERGRCGTSKQSGKGTMPCSALPKHPKQKCGEQRRIHKSEHQLQHIHDVVEAGCHVRCCDRKRDTKDGSHTSHPEVVFVRCGAVYVRLIDVIRPNGIESCDVAGHAAHKACQ